MESEKVLWCISDLEQKEFDPIGLIIVVHADFGKILVKKANKFWTKDDVAISAAVIEITSAHTRSTTNLYFECFLFLAILQ